MRRSILRFRRGGTDFITTANRCALSHGPQTHGVHKNEAGAYVRGVPIFVATERHQNTCVRMHPISYAHHAFKTRADNTNPPKGGSEQDSPYHCLPHERGVGESTFSRRLRATGSQVDSVDHDGT